MLFLKFVTFHFFSGNDKSVFSNVEICAVFKFSVLQNNLKSKEVDSTKIPHVISGSCCGCATWTWTSSDPESHSCPSSCCLSSRSCSSCACPPGSCSCCDSGSSCDRVTCCDSCHAP